MANEAVCIEQPAPHEFRRVTVADGVAIPIGTLMKWSDPNTAAATDGDSNTFAGIAWEEKTASDGIVELTLAIGGVWDLKDSGSGMTVGAICSVGGANTVKTCTEAEVVTGDAVGKVEETASAAEVVRVHVGRYI